MATVTTRRLALVLLLIALTHDMILHVACQTFELLHKDAGIASMHTAVTRFDNVVLLDRTDIGPSQIALLNGTCRDDPKDLTLKHDCTAHSVMFTPGPNTVRPLFVFTDTWCSSGAFLADGTLLQTGGDFDGESKIRKLVPCPPTGTCDWVEEVNVTLSDPRWYATNQLLPDGRVIIIGGRAVFTYEFFPRPTTQGSFALKLLADTSDSEQDNLYPFVHLLPDGNLFIFANRDSVLFNYKTNTVLRKYPTIPGNPRNYPSAGSSVMMALDAATNYAAVEVLICGGAQLGAFRNPGKQLHCSKSCGRMVVTSPSAAWAMEDMPINRCMGDMVMLPTRDVVIINGAQRGSQGWGFASEPALNPVLYRPWFAGAKRFVVQPAGTIPRLYHSTANLLPDGRVLLAGSNTHQFYTFTGSFPTELRLEAWSPPYLKHRFNTKRPGIISAPARIALGSTFTVVFSCRTAPQPLEVNLLSAPFTTHSFSQGQRLVQMDVLSVTRVGAKRYSARVVAPANGNIAPPSYYMLFVVNWGIPGPSVWTQIM